MNTIQQKSVSSEETIVRLLHQAWVVNGVLQQTAFELRNGETYLSVNRPAIDTFSADVISFLEHHPEYRTAPQNSSYRKASLNVGEVRGIDIHLDDQKLEVEVAVEPRSSHIKSHAGIFTRVEGANIKGGQSNPINMGNDKILSANMILQKMRWHLLQLAQVCTCVLPEFQCAADKHPSRLFDGSSLP